MRHRGLLDNRLDELVEIAPFQKLHRDERQSILGVAEIVHGDDVGVLEQLERIDALV